MFQLICHYSMQYVGSRVESEVFALVHRHVIVIMSSHAMVKTTNKSSVDHVSKLINGHQSYQRCSLNVTSDSNEFTALANQDHYHTLSRAKVSLGQGCALMFPMS